jgi:hypothetical protein
MIYVIATQFSDFERSADAVDEWIRGNFQSWTHPIENFWVVEGALAADQIHTALVPLLAPDDRLVIIKTGSEAMWHGVSADAARWFVDLFPASWSERIPGKTEGVAP